MQVTRAEKIRLGVFITFTLVSLAGILFYMLGKHLIKKEDIYYIKYEESVDGLLPAASVKFNGVQIGRVKELFVDSLDVRKIIVRIAVRPGTPIKQDIVANLTGGFTITGLKSIELTGGSNEAPDIPVGGEIKAGISQLKALTGQAESIALKFETLLNNLLNITNDENQVAIAQLIKSVKTLSYNLDTIFQQNSADIKETIEGASVAMKQFQKIASRAESVVKEVQDAHPGKKVGKTLDEFHNTGKAFRKRVDNMKIEKTIAEYQKTAASFTSAANSADRVLKVVNEDLASIMMNIKESAENMEDFTRMIKDNPSLLLRTEDKKERQR
ncbi:MAG: MCE family protein [Fibrobacteria bacterium]|nr:MCE family protein [Fibrobacteria bacterium]